MQPCFTPAKQVKASVNLLSILTADLSFEYMNIKTSRKRLCTPSFLSLSKSFCRGIQSKAFLKWTKHEKRVRTGGSGSLARFTNGKQNRRSRHIKISFSRVRKRSRQDRLNF